MAAPPRVFTLPLDELIAPAEDAGRPESALSLAHALAASPPWKAMRDAVMVVRPEPRPLLGILGTFDEETASRIEALRWQLSFALQRLRYVSYAQAEADCERLAEQLLARMGRDALRRFRFAAIPRGGHLVLGMLAYALDLARDQLEVPLPPDAPLVVVDDCALTGVRFGQFIERVPNRPIVFAPLYSHPDLRTALEASEPRVTACLSARDLHDHAPAQLGDGYPAWRQRWLARSDACCRWVGLPDHVCFPWNEPDISIWNPITEREEQGWRVVPPAYCLKNRPPPGAAPARVQVQSEGKGILRPSAAVLFAALGDDVIVASTETSKAFRLNGVAAAIWRAIILHDDLKEALTTLRREYNVEEATLKNDLNAFAGELLKKGLLECVMN